MTKRKETGTMLPMTVTEGITVNVLPSEQYEFLMTTKEVAIGYETSKYSVFKTLQRNSSDFERGKHFILGVDILSTPANGPRIKWFLLSLVTFGIYGFWVAIRLKQWRIKHTYFMN